MDHSYRTMSFLERGPISTRAMLGRHKEKVGLRRAMVHGLFPSTWWGGHHAGGLGTEKGTRLGHFYFTVRLAGLTPFRTTDCGGHKKPKGSQGFAGSQPSWVRSRGRVGPFKVFD